jgi:hypothetical protein
MTCKEFNKWIMNFDTKLGKEKRKILLLFDNCPSHKITYESKNIEIINLPKNSTAITQPLDGGIIKSFKSKFYKLIMSSIISKIDEKTNVFDLYKELTIKDAIYYTSWGWNEVSTSVISNCWKHAGYEFNENINFYIENNTVTANFKDMLNELNLVDPVEEEKEMISVEN